MGIKDWFTKSEPIPEPTFEEIEADAERKLAAEYAESFENSIDEAANLLDDAEELLEDEEVQNPAEEYDVGEVDAAELLDEGMDSNYEVNVVEHADVEHIQSPLDDAEVIGDISVEVDM